MAYRRTGPLGHETFEVPMGDGTAERYLARLVENADGELDAFGLELMHRPYFQALEECASIPEKRGTLPYVARMLAEHSNKDLARAKAPGRVHACEVDGLALVILRPGEERALRGVGVRFVGDDDVGATAMLMMISFVLLPLVLVFGPLLVIGAHLEAGVCLAVLIVTTLAVKWLDAPSRPTAGPRRWAAHILNALPALLGWSFMAARGSWALLGISIGGLLAVSAARFVWAKRRAIGAGPVQKQ